MTRTLRLVHISSWSKSYPGTIWLHLNKCNYIMPFTAGSPPHLRHHTSSHLVLHTYSFKLVLHTLYFILRHTLSKTQTHLLVFVIILFLSLCDVCWYNGHLWRGIASGKRRRCHEYCVHESCWHGCHVCCMHSMAAMCTAWVRAACMA